MVIARRASKISVISQGQGGENRQNVNFGYANRRFRRNGLWGHDRTHFDSGAVGATSPIAAT